MNARSDSPNPPEAAPGAPQNAEQDASEAPTTRPEAPDAATQYLARARARTAVERLYTADAARWAAVCRRLTRHLEGLAERLELTATSRVVVDGFRIKEPMRAVEKILKRAETEQLPGDPSEVVGMLTDLAGVKVLCKSSRDLEAFVVALEADLAESAQFPLAEPTKNYHAHPKPSGYRAFHAVVRVEDEKAEHPVFVEIQVRTRLQDAWGELTHDDLYKPGGPLAPDEFHSQIAASMANLLSEVDRMADLLAQDIEQTSTGEDAGPGAELPTEDLLQVIVTHTGPGYAIAQDTVGRRGLIRARDVRLLARLTGVEDPHQVKVSDLVRVGDSFLAGEVAYKGNRYFAPVEFAAEAPEE